MMPRRKSGDYSLPSQSLSLAFGEGSKKLIHDQRQQLRFVRLVKRIANFLGTTPRLWISEVLEPAEQSKTTQCTPIKRRRQGWTSQPQTSTTSEVIASVRNCAMISRKDCKCPCHRVGRGVVHVMPCCGPRGPGSGSVNTSE